MVPVALYSGSVCLGGSGCRLQELPRKSETLAKVSNKYVRIATFPQVKLTLYTRSRLYLRKASGLLKNF